MAKQITIGDNLPVTVNLEFEGTIRNFSILVENKFVPTVNNAIKDFDVPFDGDPILIVANFTAVKRSVIKKFEVIINEKTAIILKDVKFKFETIEIKAPINCEAVDLEEIEREDTMDTIPIADI